MDQIMVQNDFKTMYVSRHEVNYNLYPGDICWYAEKKDHAHTS